MSFYLWSGIFSINSANHFVFILLTHKAKIIKAKQCFQNLLLFPIFGFIESWRNCKCHYFGYSNLLNFFLSAGLVIVLCLAQSLMPFVETPLFISLLMIWFDLIDILVIYLMSLGLASNFLIFFSWKRCLPLLLPKAHTYQTWILCIACFSTVFCGIKPFFGNKFHLLVKLTSIFLSL